MAESGAWPLVMDAATARRFLSCSRQEWNAYLAAGIIPAGREITPGQPRWHRQQLERAAARLWDLEAEHRHAKAKADVDRALDAYAAAPPRRADDQQRR